MLIGGLKILQGIFFLIVAAGTAQLIHRDLVGFLNHWIVAGLRLDPDSRAVNYILARAALISPRDLRMLSLGIFLYAAIDLVEGIGLALEKIWAEYVTLVFTAAFLPWEFFELIRHFNLVRVGLITANLLILLYLLWLVQANARRRVQRLVHRNSRH
jgi:uncharacterized membrane protein (DUF2068 family)